MLGLVSVSIAVPLTRTFLGVHTQGQIVAGSIIGVVMGVAYFAFLGGLVGGAAVARKPVVCQPSRTYIGMHAP